METRHARRRGQRRRRAAARGNHHHPQLFPEAFHDRQINQHILADLRESNRKISRLPHPRREFGRLDVCFHGRRILSLMRGKVRKKAEGTQLSATFQGECLRTFVLSRTYLGGRLKSRCSCDCGAGAGRSTAVPALGPMGVPPVALRFANRKAGQMPAGPTEVEEGNRGGWWVGEPTGTAVLRRAATSLCGLFRRPLGAILACPLFPICHFAFAAAPARRCSLSRTIPASSAAGRISNGPAFTPGCFDINWIA